MIIKVDRNDAQEIEVKFELMADKTDVYRINDIEARQLKAALDAVLVETGNTKDK